MGRLSLLEHREVMPGACLESAVLAAAHGVSLGEMEKRMWSTVRSLVRSAIVRDRGPGGRSPRMFRTLEGAIAEAMGVDGDFGDKYRVFRREFGRINDLREGFYASAFMALEEYFSFGRMTEDLSWVLYEGDIPFAELDEAAAYSGPVPKSTKFELGRVMVTAKVAKAMKNDEAFSDRVADCLKRHASGDWGDSDRTDVVANERALVNGIERVRSEFDSPDGVKRLQLVVLTDADRETTIIMFPLDEV